MPHRPDSPPNPPAPTPPPSDPAEATGGALPDYEKLGLFYLGRPVDPATRQTEPHPLLYDSRDLTTHAVCVGMTGSGKTGLCLSLLEEAAMDRVPALAIDPKGDVGNLLLTFPELRPQDFRPWIDEDAARRRGDSPESAAAATAERWKKGLADWGQDGARIARLRANADFRIYTPGSRAGLPLSILASFSAPPPEVLDDPDLLRERITTVASSLLGLVGRDTDPVRSRDHILVARILEEAWQAGKDLDLAGLIRAVQSPPFDKVGVLDLDSFFPEKDRFGLAMTLNNLLASPGFEAWLEGDPLDLDRLLFTDDGKPRVAVVSIAHLSEEERMFVVSLLLAETLSWMRRNPGTGSLRALLYMDEVFGYLPPVAEPPSKRAFLTLLKQARAYGLGLVLATQNPADLDYKALSNAGTWFVGRLQTERDRERVVEGLLSASGAGLDRGELAEVLGSLGKRQFLLQNAHEPAPVLFNTRWALSYLAGPMTRTDISRLMDGVRAQEAAAQSTGADPAASAGSNTAASSTASAAAPAATASPTSAASSGTGGAGIAAAGPPILPGAIPVLYAPTSDPPPPGLTYRPSLLGLGRVHFHDAKRGVEHTEEVALLAPFEEGARAVDWQEATPVDWHEDDLRPDPAADDAAWQEPPAPAREPKRYTTWKRELADTLYRDRRLTLKTSPLLDELSRPGESDRDFKVRLAPLLRAERDRRLAEVEDRLGKQLGHLDDQIHKAEERSAREAAQVDDRKRDAWISGLSAVATIGSALFGRGRVSRASLGRATTAARGVGRVQKERREAEAAAERVADLQSERETLAAQLDDELRRLGAELDGAADHLEEVEIAPRRADVEVRWTGLAWVPDAD